MAEDVKDLAWKCSSCDSVLGYVTSDLKMLRMKYKDHYIFIEEASRVTTLCRRCGKECYLAQKT
jgi:hypothetical protein